MRPIPVAVDDIHKPRKSSGWLDSYLDREHLGLFGLNAGEKQGLTIRVWREDEFSRSGSGT